jgi:hypothetical protein
MLSDTTTSTNQHFSGISYIRFTTTASDASHASPILLTRLELGLVRLDEVMIEHCLTITTLQDFLR